MGAALDTLGTGFRITRENPRFVVVVFVTGVVSVVVGAVLGIVPLVGPIANSLLVSPALTALLLGMAFAGLVTGDATLDAGVQSVRTNYLSLVGAYALFLVGMLAVMFLFTVVPVAVAVFALPMSGSAASGSAASLAGAGGPEALQGLLLASGGLFLAVMLLAVVVGTVVVLALQFFGVAVVVGGESAVSSFRASWQLFRSGPVSVVGYNLLGMLVGIGAFLLVGAAYAVGMLAADWTVGVVLGGLAAIAVLPFTAAFLVAYQAAYYDERMGNRLDAA